MSLKEEFEAIDTIVSASRIRQQMEYVGYEKGLAFFKNDAGQGRILMPRAVEDFSNPASGVSRVIKNARDESCDLFAAGAINAAMKDVERNADERALG